MKKILIAEDDFFSRDIYSHIFSVSGHEVQVVYDGLPHNKVSETINNFFTNKQSAIV